MALTKAQKQKIIQDLKQKIDRQKAIVFVALNGLKVKELSQLRKEMKEKNCELKVAKKTLVLLAFKEKNIEIDPKKLQGELALGFGYQDQILPFKIMYAFSKQHPSLKILAGFIGKFIEKEKAIEIAQLPTREELLARLTRVVREPLLGLVNVLQGNLRGLVYVLSQIKK